MKLNEILDSIHGKAVLLHDQTVLEKEFIYVSATDLMSDALAMVKSKSDITVLLTGLVNAQSLRTAEMLDISTLIFVRDKTPTEEDLELANELEFNLFSTPLSMYEACGQLYAIGLRTATK